MGPLLLLGLLGLGAGWALWDMFDGKDEAVEETPEPVEGGEFVLDGTDDATEGTTGTLHLVATDEAGNAAYSNRNGIVDVYCVPEGESFDPENPDNATKVAVLTFETVEGVTEYPFPDHDTYLSTGLPTGSVTVVAA